MKRESVSTQTWLALLVLACVSILTPADRIYAEGEAPVVETTAEGKETPTPTPLPEKRPHLEAESPVFDFGTIRGGDIKSISHTFVFRNTGEAPLKINKIKPSCGCTSAIASATEVAPGATASITATVNPKGKSGNQTITVRVNTNDPANNSMVFRMSGTILSAWRVVPAQLDMGALAKLQSATKNVSVSSQYMKDDRQYRITGIKTGDPNIKASTAAAPAPKNSPINKSYIDVQQLVRINVTAGTTEGDQSQRVYIATNDPKNPTHTVTVRWTVEGDIHCTPNRVTVVDTKGKKHIRDVTLSSHSSQPFDITGIEIKGKTGNDDVTVTLKPDALPAQKVYQVSPNIVSNAPSETRSGKIIFKTSNPEKPEVSIPYTVSFRK